LIAGGGSAVDVLRTLDRVHGLGDVPAHHLALQALDLTATILAALIPGTLVVDRLGALPDAWGARSIPILAPRRSIIEIDRARPDPLPASWDVTSDSIAARLADHLGARCLILLKSAALPNGASRGDAARLGLVDPILPATARSIPRIEYLNLREPALEPSLLPP
jgi:aspartokinase-like uncharacterized kinase